MRKLVALICAAATITIVLAMPASADSHERRPPADGGYFSCPDGALIAEVGIRYRHRIFPGTPTVFHVVPSNSGRSFLREIWDSATEGANSLKPSWRTLGLFAIPVVGPALGGTSYADDLRDNRRGYFKRYREDFIDCLNAHPRLLSGWRIADLFGFPLRLKVRSWNSIYVQLDCHVAGASIPKPGDNLGGPTWDLEGHRGEPPRSLDPFDLALRLCRW